MLIWSWIEEFTSRGCFHCLTPIFHFFTIFSTQDKRTCWSYDLSKREDDKSIITLLEILVEIVRCFSHASKNKNTQFNNRQFLLINSKYICRCFIDWCFTTILRFAKIWRGIEYISEITLISVWLINIKVTTKYTKYFSQSTSRLLYVCTTLFSFPNVDIIIE